MKDLAKHFMENYDNHVARAKARYEEAIAAAERQLESDMKWIEEGLSWAKEHLSEVE